MARHSIDNRKSESMTRLHRFAEVERRQGAEGAHPAAKALIARPRGEQAATRIRQFLRIARGHSA